MILESAPLCVRPGRAADFERAFERAQEIVAASPGYRGHELRRCIEKPDEYLLLVWWERLEDHTEGFRGSDAYPRWKALLHDFYDPFPTVLHYEPALAGGGPQT